MNKLLDELSQNAKIRELAERSGCSIDRLGYGEGNLEKLAELIVKECLLCCERTISDPVPESVDTFEQGGIHCMDEIKQHFGIGMSTEDKKNLIKELLGVKNA